MSENAARQLLEALDPDAPWMTEVDFLQALVAHFSFFREELRKVTFTGVSLHRLIVNVGVASPAKFQIWLLNDTRYRHSINRQELAMIHKAAFLLKLRFFHFLKLRQICKAVAEGGKGYAAHSVPASVDESHYPPGTEVVGCWLMWNVQSNNELLCGLQAVPFGLVKVYEFFIYGRFRGFRAYRSIAGVVLCVTGAEALYADMGHFGARPITTAWFVMVFPCLILQYLGQAIVLAKNPAGVNDNPLYQTVPDDSYLWPLFILAALAAVIASQALISGIFTLMSQAHALGLVPRLLVLHTNPDEKGQVYIPEVNWILMTACIIVTLAFRTSDNLVAAYGIAVTGAFIFTTLLLFWVLWRVWGCNLCVVLLAVLPMITVDIVFWSANLLKLLDSGWLPMAVAGTIFFLMHTHEWGRQCEMAQQVQEEEDELSKMCSQQRLGLGVCTLQGLKNVLRQGQLLRTKSTAVFLTPRAGRVPVGLSTIATKLGALPATIVLLHIEYSDEPFVLETERVVFSAEDQSLGLWCATFRFGYAEPLTPARFDLHSKLAAGELAMQLLDYGTPRRLATPSLTYEGNLELPEGSDGADNFTYVVNRKLLVPHDHSGLCTRLRVTVYSLLKKNSRSPMSTFGLEGQSVLEVASVRKI
ncbi:kup [Symbiodinium sp. CCMP2592]|nr:kup [Symbiodinium sp. CCMP2592]